MKIKNWIIVILILLIFVIFFTNAKIVSNSVVSTLNFCAASVIPALFPYMVISSFIIYTACLEKFLTYIPNMFFRVLGVCKKYFIPILIGNLCGFVTGAKCICEIYTNKGTENDGFSDSVILSSNAGAGFVIGCVGSAIWGDIRFGIFLYIMQILSAIALNRLMYIKKAGNLLKKKEHYKRNGVSLINAFSNSISCSCTSILNVCAFVIFYSVIIDLSSSFFNVYSGGYTYSLLNAMLEFCRGSFAAVTLKNTTAGAAVSGFCIGFGGLCVHSQIFSVCEGFPLDKRKFFIFKLMQGIICSGACAVYANTTNLIPATSVSIQKNNVINEFFIMFCFAILITFIKKWRKKDFF